MAVTNIAGNAEEGSQIIINKQQISNHHLCEVKIDIADAKYDIIANYEYIRGSGSIPIIDYNPRNEKLSKQDLINRGYDQNGYPFAPCGLLCRPNGFDKTRQRLTFCLVPLENYSTPHISHEKIFYNQCLNLIREDRFSNGMNFKQCLKLRQKAMENLNNHYDIANCSHLANATGFTKHMYVKEHPRLVNLPR